MGLCVCTANPFQSGRAPSGDASCCEIFTLLQSSDYPSRSVGRWKYGVLVMLIAPSESLNNYMHTLTAFLQRLMNLSACGLYLPLSCFFSFCQSRDRVHCDSHCDCLMSAALCSPSNKKILDWFSGTLLCSFHFGNWPDRHQLAFLPLIRLPKLIVSHVLSHATPGQTLPNV